MQDIEQEILKVFKAGPGKEHDTSELAETVFKEESLKIKSMLDTNDKHTIQQAKNLKFKLHRKLLYYLNKFVEDKILSIARIKEKGEKSFILALDEGEITLEKGYKKIVITKPATPSNYIEKFEKLGIMKKFEEDSFVNRLNAIMLEAPLIKHKLNLTIRDILKNVNDVICVNDFQEVLDIDQDLIEKLNTDVVDLDKTISILIDLQDIDSRNLMAFIDNYCRINPSKINIIFSMNSKSVNKNSELLKNIIGSLSRSKIKFNILNRDLSPSPMFKGRAGIYSLDEESWKLYQKSFQGKIKALSVSHSSIAININKFFDNFRTDSDFRQAVISAAKVLLSANAIQKRKSNEYFRNINVLNAPYTQDFFKFSRNYIRLWNYDWYKDIMQNSNLLELIKSSKEVMENFCISEETIYKSCGIPMRFKITLSSAFKNFEPKFMGEREYKKTNIRKIEDYSENEIKEFILTREKIFEIYDGCDRLRIFRTQDFKPEDIVRETALMFNTYKIPFFTYDFSSIKGVIKLTNYF
ncbi:TPA: hypothetical protein HA235_03235 [Candidatus Woesearchaeota archaeon]|nr:hypothetical protein [Candidatus Woesearchaeota archaeon]HIH31697.1 hypothetical protein [Candidatus Woesearchaeota archaeon]HIH54960.1 hypothetical protein [Candidatus Woesearchaeota archaeon]HIJ02653.1 hypothetical protein [Candidatus Woesearchaeota archaeon]HIJ13609.1 hypothetical protein [Candidatus Woesearchaeota archaeon]